MSTVQKTLTFEKDLPHAFIPLSTKLEQGVILLEDLTALIRLRLDADTSLVRGLYKVLNRMETSQESEYGTIKDSLDAIKADIKNEYTAKTEYVNSLHDDVYKPLTQFKDQYTRASRQYAQTSKQLLQSLRDAESKYQKTKSRYEKAIREAELARNQLQATKKEYGLLTPQVNKMGTKVDIAMQTQQQWKTRYDEEQQNVLQEKDHFRDEMATVLRGMEGNELLRLQTVGDCLRKWAVFTTNLCANRNYDIQALAQIMSLVKPEEDLQVFMKEMLLKYPASAISAKIADDALALQNEPGSVYSKSVSASLTVESKSVDGSILGHHENITNHIDIDTSNLKNHHVTNGTNENSTSTEELRANNGSFSKLFTGLKLSKRLLEQMSPQTMTSNKMDDLSIISNESNSNNSNGGRGSIPSPSPNVSGIKRPQTMKKPRRLIYEPQIKTVHENNNSGNHNDYNQANDTKQMISKNSKLVAEPRPIIPPPKPPVDEVPLPPILDTRESEEISSENITNKESNIPHDETDSNGQNNINSNNPNDNKSQETKPNIHGGSSSMSSVLDTTGGESEVATPRNVDIPDESALHHTRSVPSTASTPTLSGADSQFDWASRSPYV